MKSNEQPNILLIMSDQHHPQFMGCAGEEQIQTPYLDILAARGTRFSNAYCNFPLCCPSRMSFMTSRYASDIDCLSNHSQLGSDTPTFAHAFNAGGYETVLCGRMHFNGADQRHGFQKRIIGDVTQNFGDPVAGMKKVLGSLSGTTGPSTNAIRQSGPGYSGYQAYDEAVSSKAADWLRQRDPQAPPFMMVTGFVMPHAPFVAQPDDYALYNDRIRIEDLPVSHPQTLHPALRDLQRRAKLEGADPVPLEDQRRARTAYYGMCTHVDRLAGRVLEALDEAGLTEDTIVIYTSDHGEQLGQHGMWWKHTFYEASISVPLIMAGPSVPKGIELNQNVSLLDIGPTLLDMTNCPSLPQASGHSFRCLLEDSPENWPDSVFAENLWPPEVPTPHRMLKQGAWKLCYYPGHTAQLFNLKDDPQEVKDLFNHSSCREIQNQMMTALLAGWNQEQITARRKISATIESWTRQWQKQSDLPDPDGCWYETPPVNCIVAENEQEADA